MQCTRPILLELAVQREICGEETKERWKQRASWLQHVYTAVCIHSWFRKPGHHCNSSLSSFTGTTLLLLTEYHNPACTDHSFVCRSDACSIHCHHLSLSLCPGTGPGTYLATRGKEELKLARCLPLTESSIDNWTTVCAGGSSSRQNGKNPVRHS